MLLSASLPCLACSSFSPAALVPHGDHMDRVAVYDTTRASPWENAMHMGRKLLRMK
jgi:hypothetical protein